MGSHLENLGQNGVTFRKIDQNGVTFRKIDQNGVTFRKPWPEWGHI